MLIATLAGLLLTGPAAAQYPPAAPSAFVSTDVVAPGGELEISSEGWRQPEAVLDFFSAPNRLRTAPVDEDGSFSAVVTIPAEASLRMHTIRVSGNDPAGNPAQIGLASRSRRLPRSR